MYVTCTTACPRPHFLSSSQLLAPASPRPLCPAGSLLGHSWACMSACCVPLLLSAICLCWLASQALLSLLSPSWLAFLLLVASSVPATREGSEYLLSAYCIPTALPTLSPSITASIFSAGASSLLSFSSTYLLHLSLLPSSK